MATGTSHLISAINIAFHIKHISMFLWLMMLTVCLMIGLLMTLKAHNFSPCFCLTTTVVLGDTLAETGEWKSTHRLCSQLCVTHRPCDFGQAFYPFWTWGSSPEKQRTPSWAISKVPSGVDSQGSCHPSSSLERLSAASYCWLSELLFPRGWFQSIPALKILGPCTLYCSS